MYIQRQTGENENHEETKRQEQCQLYGIQNNQNNNNTKSKRDEERNKNNQIFTVSLMKKREDNTGEKRNQGEKLTESKRWRQKCVRQGNKQKIEKQVENEAWFNRKIDRANTSWI